MSQAIVAALYTKLTADQSGGSFYDDLGGRIFTGMGPQDADLPLAVIGVDANAVESTYSKRIETTAFVMTIYGAIAAGATAVSDIEAKGFSLLHGAEITPTGYDRGVLRCLSRDDRDHDEEVVVSTSVYEIEATTS